MRRAVSLVLRPAWKTGRKFQKSARLLAHRRPIRQQDWLPVVHHGWINFIEPLVVRRAELQD